MKKIFLLVILVSVLTTSMFANVYDKVETNTASDTLRYYEDRIKLYEIDKIGSNVSNRSLGVEKRDAFLLSMTFPGLGHIYAGDYKRGVPFFWVELLEVAVIVYGASRTDDAGAIISISGIVSWIFTKYIEGADAMITIDDKNAELRQRLGINY